MFIPKIRNCLQLKLFHWVQDGHCRSQTDTAGVDRSISLIKSLLCILLFSAKWSMSSFPLFGIRDEDTRLFSGEGRERVPFALCLDRLMEFYGITVCSDRNSA